MGRLLARLLGSLCLVTLALSQGNDIAYEKLNVFSNLLTSNNPKNTFLPPFPVGLQLDLTCQTLGRKTYWYERKETFAALDTDDFEPVPDLHSSVVTIKALSSSDDGRQLICMRDGSTNRVDVELNVVDTPEDITVMNMTEFTGKLTCAAFAMNSQLELCWYKDDRRQICQVPAEDGPSIQTVVTVDVNLGALEKQGNSSVFSCRPKLVQTEAISSLSSSAFMHYRTLFRNMQENVEINVDRRENCESNSPANLVFEDESGCYEVRVNTTKASPTKSTPTKTTAALTKPPSTTEILPSDRKADSSSAADHLVQASTGAVLLALAAVVL